MRIDENGLCIMLMKDVQDVRSTLVIPSCLCKAGLSNNIQCLQNWRLDVSIGSINDLESLIKFRILITILTILNMGTNGRILFFYVCWLSVSSTSWSYLCRLLQDQPGTEIYRPQGTRGEGQGNLWQKAFKVLSSKTDIDLNVKSLTDLFQFWIQNKGRMA